MKHTPADKAVHDIQGKLAFQDLLERNVIEGHYCVANRYGYHVDTEAYSDNEVILTALVDPDELAAFLPQSKVPANESMGEIGIPSIYETSTSNGPVYYPGYASCLHTQGLRAEPIIIRRRLPVVETTLLEPSQDFVFYYELVKRQRPDGVVVWDDLRNRCSDVILIQNTVDRDTGRDLTEAKVLNRYLLDYIAIRRKALLVGYFGVRWYHSLLTEVADAIAASSREIIDEDRLLKYWIHIKSGRDLGRPLGSMGVLGRFDAYKAVLPPDDTCVFSYNTSSERLVDSVKDITLPTRVGSVHPAIFLGYTDRCHASAIAKCSYMEMVYFRQQVLAKYENTPGFRIGDDGDLHYASIWGISRGIFLLGYDLLGVHIGDWATELDISEWQHWAQYSVPPPSHEELMALDRIATLPQLVNAIGHTKDVVNRVYIGNDLVTHCIGAEPKVIFREHHELPAICSRLKRVLPDPMPEQDFLQRMVDLDKLVNEAVDRQSLLDLMDAVDPELSSKIGSLKLLTTALVVCKVASELIPRDSRDLKDIVADISKYSRLILKLAYHGKADTTGVDIGFVRSIVEEVKPLLNELDILFLVYEFRIRGAHLSSAGESTQLLGRLRSFGLELTLENPDYRGLFPQVLMKTRQALLALASVLQNTA